MHPVETYTVCGYWRGSQERYRKFFNATSARDAEEQMLAFAREEDDEFRISGTLPGLQSREDASYAPFIDPDDPENDNRPDLQAVVNEFAVEEWTVLGLIESSEDAEWNELTGGERYLGRQMALSPRIAEDLARMDVRERGGLDLLVTGVFRGTKNRCEVFPYANHDVRVPR